MFAEYLAILLAIIFAIFLASTFWSLSHFLGPRTPEPEKMIPYECGSETQGTRDLRFSIKFFPVLVLFLVFDVGVVLLYMWAVTVKSGGWSIILYVLPFIFILTFCLFYAIRKGMFQWRI